MDPAVDPEAGADGQKTALRVLLAVTDDDLAPAAIAVTRELQERRDARPSVLYVLEVRPSPPETAGIGAALMIEMSDPLVRAKQERALRAVLLLDEGPPAAWPFVIEVGGVAAMVVEEARRVSADIIVMGLNRHGAIGRLFGNDTVREVMALGGVPVLAVRPELVALPRRVVAAVDFSRASIRAAHLAARIMDEHGTMHIVFVDPGMLSGTSESIEGLRLIQSRGVEAAFSEIASELETLWGITVRATMRDGNPAEQIARFCGDIKPDLVAVGGQRRPFLDRLFLGSVAKSIAGDGRWSILATPPLLFSE